MRGCLRFDLIIFFPCCHPCPARHRVSCAERCEEYRGEGLLCRRGCSQDHHWQSASRRGREGVRSIRIWTLVGGGSGRGQRRRAEAGRQGRRASPESVDFASFLRLLVPPNPPSLPLQTFDLYGKDREFLQGARAREMLEALLAPGASFRHVRLSTKSFGREAARVVVEAFTNIKDTLREADLSDIIAGRPVRFPSRACEGRTHTKGFPLPDQSAV